MYLQRDDYYPNKAKGYEEVGNENPESDFVNQRLSCA
jgi:hypothetical protein